MEFNSFKNKEFIWNLCLENKLFNNLNNEYFPNAKSKFDEIFNKLDNEQLNLTEKNKKIISIFSTYIKDLKLKNFNYKHDNNIEILKPLEEVKITVDDNFKNKQVEFENLININKPKAIQFNDKDDDSPFSENELTQILEKTKQERDLVTPNISNMSNMSNMSKKVHFQKDNQDNKSSSENSDSIGSLESLDLDKPAISFIDKLKKNNSITSNNNELDKKLNIIINNQEKIIKLLESQSNLSSGVTC